MSKICWKNYHGALEDLEKINVLDANNVVILSNLGNVKQMSKDYQGALEDFDKVNVLESNNAFNLKTCGDVKRML
jgi:tetratricopeptide (TPR) repeat protein